MIDFFNNRPLQQYTPPLVRGDGGDLNAPQDLTPLFSFLGESVDRFVLAKASAPVAEATPVAVRATPYALASVFAVPAFALLAIVGGFGGLAYTLYDALQNEEPQAFKPDLQFPLPATPFLITNPFGDFVKRMHKFQANAKRNARAAELRLKIAQRKADGRSHTDLSQELAALDRRGVTNSDALRMVYTRPDGKTVPNTLAETLWGGTRRKIRDKFKGVPTVDSDAILTGWVTRHGSVTGITLDEVKKAFLTAKALSEDEMPKFCRANVEKPDYFTELLQAISAATSPVPAPASALRARGWDKNTDSNAVLNELHLRPAK